MALENNYLRLMLGSEHKPCRKLYITYRTGVNLPSLTYCVKPCMLEPPPPNLLLLDPIFTPKVYFVNSRDLLLRKPRMKSYQACTL